MAGEGCEPQAITKKVSSDTIRPLCILLFFYEEAKIMPTPAGSGNVENYLHWAETNNIVIFVA
jgi:hypothetical protein